MFSCFNSGSPAADRCFLSIPYDMDAGEKAKTSPVTIVISIRILTKTGKSPLLQNDNPQLTGYHKDCDIWGADTGFLPPNAAAV